MSKLTIEDLRALFEDARDDHPARKSAPPFQKKSVAMKYKRPLERVYLANGDYYEVKNR